jgi:hypothetical protein
MGLLNGFKFWSPVWLAVNVFTLYKGKGGGGAAAPDYSAMAAASEKAAVLGKELGDAQLAENKRQYDQNFAVSQPIVKAQTDLAYQQVDQGNDYYNYMKQVSRPTETALFYEAMGFNPDEIAQIEASRSAETTAQKQAADAAAAQRAATPQYATLPVQKLEKYYADGAVSGTGKQAIVGYTEGGRSNNMYSFNTGPQAQYGTLDPNKMYIKGANGAYIETAPQYRTVNDTASVQINGGQSGPANTQTTFDTPETNAMISKLAATAGLRNQQEASDKAIADSRVGYTNALNMAVRQGLRYGASPAKIAAAAGGLGTQQATASLAAGNAASDKVKNTLYAKKMDVAGLMKGLPGASQAAYGLTIGAGNSAVNNTMAPSQAYMGGIAQGNSTIQNGMGQKISGLGNILQAQTSVYNNSQQSDSGGLFGMLGQIGGSAASSWITSDRRLKTNIHKIGTHASGLNLYSFDYVWGESATGVMADEVMKIKPHAVRNRGDGYMEVNYGAL